MTMWDLLFPSAMAVTSTLGFLVQYLLYHPDVQKKMQQELDEVVGQNRLPTLDDRPKWEFYFMTSYYYKCFILNIQYYMWDLLEVNSIS